MHILMGLRYDSKEVDRLLKGVRSMEESSTYQAILEKGIEKGIEKGLQRGVEQGRLEEARSRPAARRRQVPGRAGVGGRGAGGGDRRLEATRGPDRPRVGGRRGELGRVARARLIGVGFLGART
jgi:hypothetical protein